MKPYDPTYMEAWTAGQTNQVVVNVEVADRIGMTQSVVLTKIIEIHHKPSPYTKDIDGQRWVRLTYTQWSDLIFPWLTERAVRYFINCLEEAGLIISMQLPSVTDKSKYYRPDNEAIYNMLTDTDPEHYAQDEDNSRCDKNCQIDVTKSVSTLRQNLSHAEKSDDTINELKKNKELKDKDKELKDPAPLKKRRTSVRIDEPRPRDLIFDAVAEVTQFDPKLTGSRIAKASNALKKAGYIPEDVTSFLGWWKQFDFRWKQSKQLPSPEDVINLIARSKTSSHGPLSEPTNLYPADYVPGMTVKEYTERKNHVTN